MTSSWDGDCYSIGMVFLVSRLLINDTLAYRRRAMQTFEQYEKKSSDQHVSSPRYVGLLAVETDTRTLNNNS